MNIDLLILHWNNPEVLLQTLSSFHVALTQALDTQAVKATQIHFWVMDNGSDFPIWDELQKLWEKEKIAWGTNLHLERSAFNRGFAAGHNELLNRIQKTKALKAQDWIFFVNSDIRVGSHFFEDFARVDADLKKHSTLKKKIFFPTLLEAGKTWHGGKIQKWRLTAKMSPKPVFQCEKVEFTTGAFWITTFQDWQNLGGWNEKFFFYGEDLEACVRAKNKGFDLVELAGLSASHEGHASVGKSSARSLELHFRARKLLLPILWPEPWTRVFPLLVVSAELLLKSLCWTLSFRFERAKASLKAWFF